MPCTAHPHASLTPFQLCLHMSLSSCRTRVQPMHMIRTCLHTSPCIYLWTPYHNVHATNTWALHYTHTCLPHTLPSMPTRVPAVPASLDYYLYTWPTHGSTHPHASTYRLLAILYMLCTPEPCTACTHASFAPLPGCPHTALLCLPQWQPHPISGCTRALHT